MLGMFKSLLTTDSPLSCIDLDQKAKKTHFIQRKSRKFSAHGILFALIKCAIIGNGSFHHIASHLKDLVEQSSSRQAVFQRINETCVDYLKSVVIALIAQQAESASAICKKLGLKRILTEDSTFQRMHNSNAGNYPAHGNKQGATAGFKVDLIYNLLTGKAICQKLSNGTEQDKKLGRRILSFVKRGDLVLRDMGYFSAEIFEAISAKMAHWLSRLPANVSVTTLDGVALEKLLKPRKNKKLDIIVRVGKEGLTCRFVAVRADDKLARERRRQRKQNSKTTPSQQALVRDGWHILLTSLDDSHSAEDLFEIYKLRWNIEVRFKAWKQALNMKKLFKRSSNFYHQESLIHAALIFQLLTLNIAAELDLKDRSLSLENFSKEIAKAINLVTRHGALLAFEFDRRHITMEIRTRKSLMDQLLTL
jgi:IS4 transposase